MQLAAGVVRHPELAVEHGEAGPPGGAPRVALEHPYDRSQLAETPLLATDAEHLDRVGAGRVPAGEEPPPLLRAVGGASAAARSPSQSESALA